VTVIGALLTLLAISGSLAVVGLIAAIARLRRPHAVRAGAHADVYHSVEGALAWLRKARPAPETVPQAPVDQEVSRSAEVRVILERAVAVPRDDNLPVRLVFP
jgi:hypothetical protein